MRTILVVLIATICASVGETFALEPEQNTVQFPGAAVKQHPEKRGNC